MKYLALLLAVLMLVCYGCASKPAQTAQKPLTAEEQARLAQEEALKRKEREARISEEDLAKTRADRERLEREKAAPQEKKSAIPVSDIYFEYDSHSVQPEDMAKIKEMSEWLKLNGTVRIIVEGHCDERGTVEYNLALGQKRAEVVKNHLTKLGIDEKRVRAISFGKEMPADPGHTEDAWAKNRRVHFALDQKG
jgi:peptidoglycan-associated lipoprotein